MKNSTLSVGQCNDFHRVDTALTGTGVYKKCGQTYDRPKPCSVLFLVLAPPKETFENAGDLLMPGPLVFITYCS